MHKFHIFVVLSSITKKGEIKRSLFGFGNWVITLSGLICCMEIYIGISPHEKELIAYESWHGVMWSRWWRSRQGLASWTGCNGEGQVEALKWRTARRWSLGKTWCWWTKAMVKSGQGRGSMDQRDHVMIWSDHIILDRVGALVALALEGWRRRWRWNGNAQGKGIT